MIIEPERSGKTISDDKPMKVMHDGGKEFTSNKFKNFLSLSGIKDKQIPKGYLQEQGKVEAYNKIIIAEFLQEEELIDEKDGAKKYEFLSIHITMKENMVG